MPSPRAAAACGRDTACSGSGAYPGLAGDPISCGADGGMPCAASTCTAPPQAALLVWANP